MTMYRAAVKYAVDATRNEKIAALRDGLQDIAVELVEEHGLDLEDVERALDLAYTAAEYSAEYVARWKAEHPA